MGELALETRSNLEKIIEKELIPYVRKVDSEAFYAKNYLKKLGEAGLFSSAGKSQRERMNEELFVVEETAKVCMTTAFCVWCHLAGLTYLRSTDNSVLKNKLLPLMEAGEILGATGLSNPMKYYAGLEDLRLHARQTKGGYIFSGVLPAVSNLCQGHWFGVIARTENGKEIMAMIPFGVEGLITKERTEFFAANGSATYSCQFNDIFIPSEWVLSEKAADFAVQIRPAFVIYQIPIGFGVIGASIESMEKVRQRQNGCNQFLQKQPEELRSALENLKQRLQTQLSYEKPDWKEVAGIRLETAYLTLDAVQAAMLHNGSAGYLRNCDPARRLREAYFFANLTPTIKHLEKVQGDRNRVPDQQSQSI